MGHARHARLRCPYCKRTRYFLLEELQKVFGDIDCDAITGRQKWRCAGCGENMRLDMRLEDPPPGGGAIVSRIERVYYVKRIVWRDEWR